MRVCIHRGAAQIGGSCVEVEAACGDRLVLDMGVPLDASPTDALLPPVAGLKGPDQRLKGIAISHAHQDHYGLLPFVQADAPVMIGPAAERIITAAAPFVGSPIRFRNTVHWQDRQPVTAGAFTITPYLVDHSAYDAYALLVEADGRRLFYSGDLRGHGRKQGLFHKLVRLPPRDVDVMLLEGSTMGRLGRAHRFPSESELEARFVERFKATPGLALVWASSQNLDRVVTIFRAALASGRVLVVDLYTAVILEATGNEHIPQADWDQVVVYVPERQRVQVKRLKAFEPLRRIRDARIFIEQLGDLASRAVMLYRPLMTSDLRNAGLLGNATLTFSQWEGYLDTPSFAKPIAEMGLPLEIIHTSGHASVPDLQRLAASVDPRALVPIHSFHPGDYAALFRNVEVHGDGEWWAVGA